MIWIDLDETLIHAAEQPVANCQVEVNLPRERLWFGCRPGANECLKALRELAEVRMLTVATHAYASAANACFEFGFESGQIVAREQWVQGWVVERAGKMFCDIDLGGVLIDNKSADYWHRYKRLYLGIGQDRLLLVPDYYGGLSDSWPSAIPSLVGKVRELLARKSGSRLDGPR